MVVNIYVDGKYPEQIHLFKKYVQNKSKYDFQITEEFEKCDIFLMFDVVNVNKRLEMNQKKIFRVLIRQEPQLVVPQNYLAGNIEKFNLIIDIGKPPTNSFNSIYWPQDLTRVEASGLKLKKIVLINSNLLSFWRGEQYSLRRVAAKHLKDLDLYGRSWNNDTRTKLKTVIVELSKFFVSPFRISPFGLRHYFHHFHNYLGAVDEKKKVLSKYQFCLVIENSSDYVSEKLFDAFSSGCIPIYVGPQLSSYNIPDYLYFQAEPNFKSIKEKLNQARKIDYANWSDQVVSWLSQPETHETWSQTKFYSKIENYLQDFYQ